MNEKPKMNDDYLWNGTGEPDPEIQKLESVLGRLRHDPERHPVYGQRQWNHLCDEREVRLPVLDVPSQRARPICSSVAGEWTSMLS